MKGLTKEINMIYDYEVATAKGNALKLSEYKGKVILVVNTATGCGFTPQYAPIEQLYKDYHDKGLEILDIPCNQFGGQAPGSDEEIHNFCKAHFNTTFLQMKKADVNGPNELPLYTYLKSKKGFEGFEGFEGFGGPGNNGRSGVFRGKDGSYTTFHFEGGDGGDYSNLFEHLFRNAGAANTAGGTKFYRSGSGTGGFGSGTDGFGGSGGFNTYSGAGSAGGAGGNTYGSSYGGFSGGDSAWGAPESLDAEFPVTICFEEAVLGCDRNIRLQKADGSGTQTLRVHIPAGIDDGKSVRLRGKGHVSADGSRRGDLLLKVTVQESKDFSRKGMDIYTTAGVPFMTAVLGGEAEVRMPNGKKIVCKIPKGTDAGRKIRIRGKGIHAEKSSAQPGDLYVTVQIQVPKDLTDAEIRKLREFETMYNERKAGRPYSA